MMKDRLPVILGRIIAGVALLCGLGTPMLARAQPAPPSAITGTADPGRIGTTVIPDSRTWQRLERPEAEKQVIPQVPEGAAEMRFVLQSLAIDGMTAYSPEEVAYLYAGYLGQEISVATLFEIMGGLQEKYLADGYTLSRVFIPNQSIEGGQPHLQVIEGYVAEVELSAGLEGSPLIADARERILAMRPLNTVRLERLLLVLNDLPGLDVSAVLATIKDGTPEPGGIRLVLQKNDRPQPFNRVSIDNYGSKFAGPYQGRLETLFPQIGFDHGALKLTAVATASLQEQKFGAVNYTLPLFGASGFQAAFGATVARTEPGSTLDPLDVRGRSKTIYANLSYPVIRQRSKTLSIDMEFSVKNSESDLLGAELYDDRQRILSAGLNYSFSDSANGMNLLDFHVSKGLDVLGMHQKGGAAALSRADGHPDFLRWNVAAARLQALPRSFQLYGMLTGQYSGTPLLSSEEFGFGGDQIGRGYNPSEISGDRAVAASVEIRYNHSLQYDGLNLTLQPYFFYDVGKVWNIDNNDTTHMSAASAGTGIRFTLSNQWNGNFSLAFPLTRPAENPPKYASRYGPRLMFSLVREF